MRRLLLGGGAAPVLQSTIHFLQLYVLASGEDLPYDAS